MITFSHKGNFDKTTKYLTSMSDEEYVSKFSYFAELGVKALSEATPVDTGETASSWYYTIVKNKSGIKIIWNNSNVTDQAPVAILIQYGHGTRDGAYVQGVDFINPAMRPVVDRISQYIRKELSAD